MEKDEEDLTNIEEGDLPDCEKFENLYLISNMLGESVPLKTIISKTKSEWMATGEVKLNDVDNGFILIKFANEMDCNHVFFDQPWFVQGQILNLQRWRRDFDPFKESIESIVIWVHLPGLPVELWGESILTKLLNKLVKLLKLTYIKMKSLKEDLQEFVLRLIFPNLSKWNSNTKGVMSLNRLLLIMKT